MGLGNYKDVYTASALSSRVDEIVSSAISLNSAEASYFDSLKLEVKDQIDRLKEKEQRIFETLHVKDAKELNERIVSYKNAVFRLTGQSLDQSIVSVLKDENEKINRLMEQAINEIVGERIKPEEYLFADGSKNLEKFKERYVQELNILFGQNRFSSKKGITMDGIFYAGLTREQQRAWKSIIAKRVGLESGYSEKDLYSKLEINEQLSGNTDNIQFNWFDTISITPGSPLTPIEAKKIPREKVIEINEQIKKKIVSLIEGSDSDLIGKIIDYILSLNFYAFFSGRNINDVTGILGEISGIYYLCKLTTKEGDSSASRVNEAIKWQGSLHIGENNQKPHVDILLDGLGIQVKNTTKDYLSRVTFSDATIDTILSKTTLSKEAKELVTNYYGTLAFNVPYDFKNNLYVHGGPMNIGEATEIYKNAIGRLKTVDEDVNELINLCASALMYMDVAEEGEDLDANVLYLVGSTFFCASYMLETVLKEIEDKEKKFKTFKVEMSTNSNKTIVEALNDHTRAPNYSLGVIGQVVLQSSYNFGA